MIQVVAAGANPVLITRGIEKTSKALVSELKQMSKEVMGNSTEQGFQISSHDCSFFHINQIMHIGFNENLWGFRLKIVNLPM